MSIYKSNFSLGIVNKENIESLVFTDAIINLIRFETFASATFLDFADFQSAPISSRQHFTNSIVNSVSNTFDSASVLKLMIQRVFRHLHQPHCFVDIFFFNSVNNT